MFSKLDARPLRALAASGALCMALTPFAAAPAQSATLPVSSRAAAGFQDAIGTSAAADMLTSWALPRHPGTPATVATLVTSLRRAEHTRQVTLQRHARAEAHRAAVRRAEARARAAEFK